MLPNEACIESTRLKMTMYTLGDLKPGCLPDAEIMEQFDMAARESKKQGVVVAILAAHDSTPTNTKSGWTIKIPEPKTKSELLRGSRNNMPRSSALIHTIMTTTDTQP